MSARSAASRKRRGRGLPACGSGVTVPTSTKPKPRPSSASGTSPSLSKPAARPSGIGKVEPERAHREPRIARRFGRRGSGACSAAPIDKPVRPLRLERRSRPAARSAMLTECPAGKDVAAVGTERQRLDLAHGRHRQRRVEMREQRAAARRLPAELPRRAPRHRRATSSRPSWPAKCRAAVSRTWAARREMDVAVGEVDRRAVETAGCLGLAPQRFRADLVDEFRHPRAG